MKTKYKHICFERDRQAEGKRKTQIWWIRGDKNDLLGRIEWYSPWREYVSNTNIIRLSQDCHLDIADFIKQLMEERGK